MTAVPTMFFCIYMQPGAMGGEEVKVFTKCFFLLNSGRNKYLVLL